MGFATIWHRVVHPYYTYTETTQSFELVNYELAFTTQHRINARNGKVSPFPAKGSGYLMGIAVRDGAEHLVIDSGKHQGELSILRTRYNIINLLQDATSELSIKRDVSYRVMKAKVDVEPQTLPLHKLMKSYHRVYHNLLMQAKAAASNNSQFVQLLDESAISQFPFPPPSQAAYKPMEMFAPLVGFEGISSQTWEELRTQAKEIVVASKQSKHQKLICAVEKASPPKEQIPSLPAANTPKS